MTMPGRFMSTSRMIPATVAGVRAVAMVKSFPSAMLRLSILTVASDKYAPGCIRVPSRSLT